MHFLKYWY